MSDLSSTRVQSPLPSGPAPQRVSKGFYLGSVAAAMGLTIILRLSVVSSTGESAGAGTPLMAAACLPMLYGAIVMLVLCYKAWASIQDGYARTTPGKAVGFLFIPFFNFYWVFQAIWGFAQDFNRYTQRHGIPAALLPEGLSLAYVLLFFVAWIPSLGILAIAESMIGLILISQVCDAVNRISQASRAQ